MKSQGLYTDNPIVGEIAIFRQLTIGEASPAKW